MEIGGSGRGENKSDVVVVGRSCLVFLEHEVAVEGALGRGDA